MFEIDENNIPFVRTRRAFLALDLQHDLLSTGGLLHVDNPPNFVENIGEVATHFRKSGDVIWIRSIFERSRAVNLTHGESEHVITDRQLLAGQRAEEEITRNRIRPSSKLLERYTKIAELNGKSVQDTDSLEVDDEEVELIRETFLTVEPGEEPQICQPSSTGSNMSVRIISYLDIQNDLCFYKTHYSAFKDGSLVQVLRAKFVTEIYICGALTNISVFATAMDAARHGYAITIVEDCLGYRSKARHDEALRQLSEFTGCDIISSAELIEELQLKSKARQAPRKIPRPAQRDSSLENLMSNLNLKPASSAASRSLPASTQSTISAAEVAVDKSSESQPAQAGATMLAEGERKKRERVKSKIKTRRRQLDPQKEPISPVSATLLAASEALEKMSAIPEAESQPSQSSESIEPEASPTGQSMDSEIQKDLVEEEKSEIASPSGKDECVADALKSEAPFPLCEGDTTVINDLLDEELSDGIFERVRDEVRWQRMSHQGGDVPRLVAVQGDFAEDGSIPIYRHPADESPPMLPFTPVVSLIRAKVEKKLGHAVNHVLIQFYRDGTDYISEHSDKTLDITPSTFIANVSLGAQRTMVFRTKKAPKDENSEDPAPPRRVCRAPLLHNSMCKMGLVTNMRWLHAIRQDKRMASEKSEAELAYNGGRISLTFRLIGTFLDKDEQKIWGQGAKSKSKESANNVINGNTVEAERMIRAFGQENHSSEFDWARLYGEGFDVLHISNSPKLFLSGDKIADLRVKILLNEYGITWVEGKLSSSFNWKDGSSRKDAPPIPEKLPVKFIDNDLSKSTVTGDLAILLYLDAVYGSKSKAAPQSQLALARQFTLFYLAEELLRRWTAVPFGVKPLQRGLELWEGFATESTFIAGSAISLADYALYPILADMASEWGPQSPDPCQYPNLNVYRQRMENLESVKKARGHSEETNGHTDTHIEDHSLFMSESSHSNGDTTAKY